MQAIRQRDVDSVMRHISEKNKYCIDLLLKMKEKGLIDPKIITQVNMFQLEEYSKLEKLAKIQLKESKDLEERKSIREKFALKSIKKPQEDTIQYKLI